MTITRAYEGVIDFIAANTSPAGVIGFQPSGGARRRVDELLEREKTS